MEFGQWHYKNLADSGTALIWTAGLDMKCNYFNKVWLDFTGRTLEQELGDGWTEGVHPDDLERCFQIYTTSFKAQQNFSMDYRIMHHSGEYRWINDTGTARFDENGVFIGYVGHCIDVTDRTLAQAEVQKLVKEKDLLLREVHHRIKNNMSTIMGLLDLQAACTRSLDARAVLLDAENRVRSMLVLYDTLFCSQNYEAIGVRAYLQTLAQQLVDNFQANCDVHLAADVEDLVLSTRALFPLGIAVNELLTNALKYAFKNRSEGQLSLGLHKADDIVAVVVHDDGPGISDENLSSGGFGTSLVRLFVQQLRGEISFAADHGTTVRITIPYEEAVRT